MKVIQGYGSATLGVGESKTFDIRQIALTHILVNANMEHVKIEVDYFGHKPYKLVEAMLLKDATDIPNFVSGNYVSSMGGVAFIPIGHLTLQKYVVSVTLTNNGASDVTVAVATIEQFVGADYLIRTAKASGSSKVYNNLRSVYIPSAPSETRIYVDDSRLVLDSSEVVALQNFNSVSMPWGAKGFLIYNPTPEKNSVTIELSDTSKEIVYTTFDFDKGITDFSLKQIKNRANSFVAKQGNDISTIAKVQRIAK